MNRDDIIRIYEKANGWSPEGWDKTVDELERFAALVAAVEREACAEMCEGRAIITPEWQLDQHYNQAVRHCAAAIRARGQG